MQIMAQLHIDPIPDSLCLSLFIALSILLYFQSDRFAGHNFRSLERKFVLSKLYD